MASKITGVPVAPLTGVLDARSSPNDLPGGAVRMRLNLRTIANNKLRRGNGWQKLFSGANYNNEDFHDQLLTFGGIRQPVTLLYEAESTRKVRSLFAATQGKIAQLNEFSGNWRILGSGYGGTQSTLASAPRFKAGRVGDFVAFTNDFDRPMYHELERNAVDAPVLLKNFDDFVTINLSKAAVVWSWKNCLFFADVEMDSERFAYRLVWSNFNDPTSFDPGKADSIAGSKDLYTHERILAGEASANSFLIYTTHGIWEMIAVGGEESFAFRRVYNGENNAGVAVLKYPNTLVALPDSHVYCAEDGIYFFNQNYGRPERAEWLHRSSSLLYDNINDGNCQAHIAKFSKNELLISVARNGAVNDCPDVTLRVNMSYKVADLIDHGFTAFCNYRSYRVPTIRDFIIDRGICTVAGLIAAGYGWVNEGLPRPIPSSTAPFIPDAFYTTIPQTVDGVTTEDWNQPSASVHSLCALLGDTRIDDICRHCEGAVVLVAASSQDWCLKQFAEVFYRERCANPTGVGTTSASGYSSSVGSYLLDGYDSLMRMSPMFTGEQIVQADQFRLDYIAQPQTPPSQLGLRIGISAMVVDPNVADCGIVWHQHSLRDMKCLTSFVEAEHLAKNTMPSEYFSWVFYRAGRVLYFEWKLSGTGGDAIFTSVQADVGLQEAKNY